MNLNIMMAKELLLLQIKQMELNIEDNMLKRKFLLVDEGLGLCNLDWSKKKHERLLIILGVYNNFLADYQMSMNTIAKWEQQAAEDLKAEHKIDEIHMNETHQKEEVHVSQNLKVDTNNSALLGDDTPNEDEKKPASDKIESIEDGVHTITEQKENVLKDKIPGGKPFLPGK